MTTFHEAVENLERLLEARRRTEACRGSGRSGRESRKPRSKVPSLRSVPSSDHRPPRVKQPGVGPHPHQEAP